MSKFNNHPVSPKHNVRLEQLNNTRPKITTPPLFNVSVPNTNKPPTVGRENSIYNGGKSGKPVMGSRI